MDRKSGKGWPDTDKPESAKVISPARMALNRVAQRPEGLSDVPRELMPAVLDYATDRDIDAVVAAYRGDTHKMPVRMVLVRTDKLERVLPSLNRRNDLVVTVADHEEAVDMAKRLPKLVPHGAQINNITYADSGIPQRWPVLYSPHLRGQNISPAH